MSNPWKMAELSKVTSGNFGNRSDEYSLFGNNSGIGYASANIDAAMRNVWNMDRWNTEYHDDIENIPFRNAHQQQRSSTPRMGIYSRKVFVGGLPLNIKAGILLSFFKQFGDNEIDWPYHYCDGLDGPPDGYAFVVFTNNRSVEDLIKQCSLSQGKFQIMLKNGEEEIKCVQIRPWCLLEQTYTMTGELPHSDRYSVFVGGVPRTTTAVELATLIQQTIGNVVYVALEVDSDTKYPKGAAQVVFDSREAYSKAVALGAVTLSTFEFAKELEIKPYLLNCSQCEACNLVGTRYLCPEICCLLYLCEPCWYEVHRQRGLYNHRPMTRSSHPSILNHAHHHHHHCGRCSNNNQQQFYHCRARQAYHPHQHHVPKENVPPSRRHF